MEKPATSTAGWRRHKQQNALALWGFAILCEWRTIGPRCKVSAWLLTDLCMPSPRQARLGTLPSLSFSPISSTNLLGAMKELNSFATLSLPKCHYHNVPQPDRPPRPALPAYRFLRGEVEGERPLTFSERSLRQTTSRARVRSRLCSFGELGARVSVLHTELSVDVLKRRQWWKHRSESKRHIRTHLETSSHLHS